MQHWHVGWRGRMRRWVASHTHTHTHARARADRLTIQAGAALAHRLAREDEEVRVTQFLMEHWLLDWLRTGIRETHTQETSIDYRPVRVCVRPCVCLFSQAAGLAMAGAASHPPGSGRSVGVGTGGGGPSGDHDHEFADYEHLGVDKHEIEEARMIEAAMMGIPYEPRLPVRWVLYA